MQLTSEEMLARAALTLDSRRYTWWMWEGWLMVLPLTDNLEDSARGVARRVTVSMGLWVDGPDRRAAVGFRLAVVRPTSTLDPAARASAFSVAQGEDWAALYSHDSWREAPGRGWAAPLKHKRISYN